MPREAVVTLIFLVLQIRQNTRQVEKSVELARVAAIKTSNSIEPSLLAIAQDPELTRIFQQGLADHRGLEGAERLRFTLVLGALIASFATLFAEQTMLGIHGNPSIGDLGHNLTRFLGTPGGRESWKRHSADYPLVFQQFVDEQVLGRRDAPSA
jgi:hypothetical protein